MGNDKFLDALLRVNEIIDDNGRPEFSQVAEIKTIVRKALESANVSVPSNCDWCRIQHTRMPWRVQGFDDVSLCQDCWNDLPQFCKDNEEYFVGAFDQNGLPNEIRKMMGSLKRFGKGIVSFVSSEDGEYLVHLFENVESFKRNIIEEIGDESGWETQSAYKDGKKINFSREVKIDVEE